MILFLFLSVIFVQGSVLGPECKFACDDPVCRANCQPRCREPRCQIDCQPYPISGINVHCAPPSCRVRCNITDAVAADSCPMCETVCDPVTCFPHDAVCSPLCEATVCSWECFKPVCRQPICQLQCERPACEFAGGSGSLGISVALILVALLMAL